METPGGGLDRHRASTAVTPAIRFGYLSTLLQCIPPYPRVKPYLERQPHVEVLRAACNTDSLQRRAMQKVDLALTQLYRNTRMKMHEV